MPQQITNGLQHWWPGFLIFGVVLVIVIALFQPWNIDSLKSRPNPVKSYLEAVQRIQAIQTGETNLNPVCRTKFLTHGDKTDRVIVFVHGYTNCPQQFADLGKQFYDSGYNVLIVPAPHHGLTDRMTDEQGHITAEELIAYTDQVVDIAPGLGKYVIISGISLGGVVAAWAAQNRSEIDLAVPIAPAFSFKQIPNWLTVPTANVFTILPVSYDWWNPTSKGNAGPPYAYPRYSKYVLGQVMRLGFAVQAAAQRTVPVARSILVVTNANDQSVNNEITAQVAQLWRADGVHLATYEFDKDLHLGHDIIDPNDTNGNIGVVYPILIGLINK